MSQNPLVKLQDYGQSFWYDNLRRGLITTGELKRMIDEDGLRGVTSNPTIFEKAISGSPDYDKALRKLVSEGKGVDEIYEALTIEDIQMAAELFLPIFESTHGDDGFVSLEVSPKLARDTEGTIAEVRKLHRLVDRKNVMIKVPATPEGIPAIEQLTGEGININITLLFSIDRYEQVADAYISGLERLAREGKPLDRVASVASFFVSRIDTAVDRQLEARLRETKDQNEQAAFKSLLGKVAIANAKLAYQKFKEIFSSPRFLALKRKGARVQRLLWGSTSTKNPHYRDVMYVEELIGPHTINTMPQTTIDAFRDHGKVRASLEEDIEGAKQTLKKLAEVGISLKQITEEQVLNEGIESFAKSFDQLMHCIAAKRELLRSGLTERQKARLGTYENRVDAALDTLSKQEFMRRLWAKDASLWKKEPEHQQVIKNRLGWLTVTEAMVERCDQITEFADRVKREGFTRALLLGMGGSSLCPEVCRLTFGTAPGYPDLAVLDSTDPVTILSLERAADLGRTLFIVSTKSGTTTETLSLYKYFWEKVRAVKGDGVRGNFIAITDPGTPLEKIAHEQNFRHVFLNPADIGGRYSALSYFGLVPAAIMGIDIKTLLDRAERMVHTCVSCVPTRDNPGAVLGAILGELSEGGLDKVTFIVSRPIESFGYWVEQLLAESTGKEGKGLVPIEGEPVGEPAVYGNDRVFIYIRLDSAPNDELDRKVHRLEEAGHPVVRIFVKEAMDIGEEFFRWEIATSVAGSMLGVNVFDEPNVKESKDNTSRLLAEFRRKGKLPEDAAVIEEDGISLYGDSDALSTLERPSKPKEGAIVSYLSAHLNQVRPGDYMALMAYVERSAENHKLLQTIRVRLRDAFRVSTTLGYGPRFLHSTGQLHKGGPNNGLFIQITADDAEDIPIPGEEFAFGTLKRAQALGDFLSLRNKGRRILRLHLSKDVEAGLEELLNAVDLIKPFR